MTDDWRKSILQHVRDLIKQAVPEAVEEMKWKKPTNPAGIPVWSHNGIICTGETYKAKVKLTFAHGAHLPDPENIFNGDDKGQTRRSIDIQEGNTINENAFKTLIRAAAKFNGAKSKQ